MGRKRVARGLSALVLFGVLLSLSVSVPVARADPPVLQSIAVDSAGHPTVDWSLPSAQTKSLFYEIATAPDTNGQGFFLSRKLAAFGVLDPGDTEVTDVFEHPAGTFYVHVAGHDSSCVGGACEQVEFSDVCAFDAGAAGATGASGAIGSRVTCAVPPAPPTLVAVGQQSRFLTASWLLAAGTASDFIEVAATPETDADGFFVDPKAQLFLVDPAQTTFQSSLQFPAGVYYVHVAAYDPACDACPDAFSGVLAVTIPADSVLQPGPLPLLPAVDKVTGFSVVKVASRQSIKHLVVRASMAENGSITVRGTVIVPGAAKVFKLKTVSARALAGKLVQVKIPVGKKALVAARRALKRHRKVKAQLSIIAHDDAGNTALVKRTIRFR